jgi:hypothetical protein
MSMPISGDMAIDPIGGTFRAFGPPAAPAPSATPAPATSATSAPTTQLPSQTTLDAIRQALQMMTQDASSDTSVDGTDPSTSDPLAAILQTTSTTDTASDTTAQDPGTLGLDAFA